jgi:hypothetical protein
MKDEGYWHAASRQSSRSFWSTSSFHPYQQGWPCQKLRLWLIKFSCHAKTAAHKIMLFSPEFIPFLIETCGKD